MLRRFNKLKQNNENSAKLRLMITSIHTLIYSDDAA